MLWNDYTIKEADGSCHIVKSKMNRLTLTKEQAEDLEGKVINPTKYIEYEWSTDPVDRDLTKVKSNVYKEDVREAICTDSLDRLSGVPEYRANGVDLPDEEDFNKKLSSYGISLSTDEPVCAYLPVWFLTYRKDDRVAYAVMNGSTGKITADLPIDEKKYILGSLLLAVPFFALLAFFLTLTGHMVLLLSSVVALISLILSARRRKKKTPAGRKSSRKE